MGVVMDELSIKKQEGKHRIWVLQGYVSCPVLMLLNNHCHTLDGSITHLT